MTDSYLPSDIDPFIAERVVAIRDRFGLGGLRAAQALIETEISIFDNKASNAAEQPEDVADR